MRRALITITGPDRVGKNTQAYLLSKAMHAKLFSFPDYSTMTGQLVRAMLTESTVTFNRKLWKEGMVVENYDTTSTLTKDSSYEFQCLQLLSRIESQNKIRTALNNYPVVCDRYDVDAIIYGKIDGCDYDWLLNMHKCIQQSDLAIILLGSSFNRDEVADINETNSNYQSQIFSAYEAASTDGCIGNIPVLTIRTNTSKDKFESIWNTHTNLVSELIAYFKAISGYVPPRIVPLSLEEVTDSLISYNKTSI